MVFDGNSMANYIAIEANITNAFAWPPFRINYILCRNSFTLQCKLKRCLPFVLLSTPSTARQLIPGRCNAPSPSVVLEQTDRSDLVVRRDSKVNTNKRRPQPPLPLPPHSANIIALHLAIALR